MEIGEFRNIPLTDFSNPENARRMRAALEKVRGELGRTYPLIVGGREIGEGAILDSVNPADPKQVVGRFVQATAELADEAVRVRRRRSSRGRRSRRRSGWRRCCARRRPCGSGVWSCRRCWCTK